MSSVYLGPGLKGTLLYFIFFLLVFFLLSFLLPLFVFHCLLSNCLLRAASHYLLAFSVIAAKQVKGTVHTFSSGQHSHTHTAYYNVFPAELSADGLVWCLSLQILVS